MEKGNLYTRKFHCPEHASTSSPVAQPHPWLAIGDQSAFA